MTIATVAELIAHDGEPCSDSFPRVGRAEHTVVVGSQSRGVLVNGHGGNLQPLRHARRYTASRRTQRPRLDTHRTRLTTATPDTPRPPSPQLRPADVSLDDAAPGNTEPLPSIIDQLREHGAAAVSPNGVLGDPTKATAGDGERILQRWADSLTMHVNSWLPRRAAHP